MSSLIRKKFVGLYFLLIAVGFTAVAFGLTVNPELFNGDFETGNLLGWFVGAYGNSSVSIVTSAAGSMAKIDSGTGHWKTTGNFAFLDQLFRMQKNNVVELDFFFSMSAESAETGAIGPQFERIEVDINIVETEPFSNKLISAVLIDYTSAAGLTGHMQVNDKVGDTVESSSFDPISPEPTTVGPLSLTPAGDGFHVSMNFSTALISWLPDEFTARVTIRNEDHDSGQDFTVLVDNVRTFSIIPEAIRQLIEQVEALDINYGIKNSLIAKLNTALRALEDANANNDAVAINSLGTFINEVEAQRGNNITEADADALIAAAQEIIAMLSGG